MRAIFSVVSLIIVLAVVGVLVKKQLTAPPLAASGSSPQAASQQMQQQIRQSIEESMRQARPMPDD